MSERQRIDVWLFRARFAKTRADATRLVSEGGVRVIRDGVARRLEKASVEIQRGDALVFPQRGKLVAVKVEALAARRGPAAEARALYVNSEAE